MPGFDPDKINIRDLDQVFQASSESWILLYLSGFCIM